MKTIRWGILGCGKIARKFASDLKYVKNAELIAVAARELSTAENFAKDFPAKYKHGSYEALVKNEEIDVVYIATPHGLHHEHALLCLRNNKAVLCEKAFALNYAQAKEMIDEAIHRNVFLMEAFWTKFLPNYLVVKKLISENKIGKIQSITSTFGFIPTPPVAPRLYDPALGGGSLLDIGVYPIFLALDLLGRPDAIHAVMTPSAQGTDSQCSIIFTYKNGALAQLFSSFASDLDTFADIAGDKGRLRLTHRFYSPSSTIEFYPTTPDSREVFPCEKASGFGYEYEAQHVTDCLLKGLTESPVLKFSDTLSMMETLDRVRAQAGIIYPADQKK
jgi:predicted dehydrogenase